MPKKVIKLNEVTFHAMPYFKITEVGVPVTRIKKVTATEMRGEGHDQIHAILTLDKEDTMFVTETHDKVIDLMNEV